MFIPEYSMNGSKSVAMRLVILSQRMIKLMTNDPYRMSCEKCRTMGEQYAIVKPRRSGASEESFWQMPASTVFNSLVNSPDNQKLPQRALLIHTMDDFL